MERYQIILELINREIDSVLKIWDKLSIRETDEFQKIYKKIEKGLNANSMSSISRHLRSLAIFLFPSGKEKIDAFVQDIKVAIFPVFFEKEIVLIKEILIAKFGEKPCLLGNLQKISKSFYDLCKVHLRKGDGELDVELVSKVVGFNIIRKPKRTYQEVLDKIILKLDELNPEEFNFRWLLDNGCRNEHYFLEGEVRNSLITWDDFVDSLPEKWRDRWGGRKYGNTFFSNLRKLRIFLEEKNPDFFNVRYLYLHCNGVWHYFYNNYKNAHTQKIDWDKVIRHLPLKWQYRWSGSRYTKVSQHSIYFFEIAIERLALILEEKNPERFSMSFIEKHDRILYYYFAKRIRDEDGYIDWRLIISCLDKKWQDKFDYPLSMHFCLPEKFYDNSEELERLIKKEKMNLYLFFCPSSTENRLECDKISRSLVKLAQGGNINALKLLKDYLEQLTAFWIENNTQLAPLLHLRREINQIIKKCIFRFRFRKVMFISYVYRSLISKADDCRREINGDFRLDENDQYGRSYYETTIADDDW